MPCQQCTDPARCENFGVCQIFKHTLPAGSYEQRIKEVSQGLPADRIEQIIDAYLEDYEMVGEAEDGRDACHQPTEGERILIKDAILGLLSNEEWDAEWGRLIAQRACSATPCKPGTRCSRSIRGLGGCEAGSCEREEGATAAPAPSDIVGWQWRRAGEPWPEKWLNFEPALTAPGTEKRALHAGPVIAAGVNVGQGGGNA